MKPFIQTTIIGFVVLIFVLLIIVCFKIEKHKITMKNQKDTIEELTDELHTMEIMYLKCQGNIESEKYGAHYVDGKIKFYRIND